LYFLPLPQGQGSLRLTEAEGTPLATGRPQVMGERANRDPTT
jgi:hypothetical protein